MKKYLFLLIATIMPAIAGWAAATLKISGETASPAVLSQYGMEQTTLMVNGQRVPALNLNNSVVSGSAIGLEYSNTTDMPLYIVVKGICVIESTGDDGLCADNQSIVVSGTGSLYIKGINGVHMKTTSSQSLNVGHGVELICEGTNGAGILGSPHPSIKNRYYGGVIVGNAATSLIVKGTTGALVATDALFMNDGASIHPDGATVASTDWIHITATGLPINATNFPDFNFRNIISERYDSHEPDGYLSRYERSLVKTMNVFQKNITDMTGVNYFTSLTSLNCGANNYHSIDISALTELVNLECYSTGLQSIDLSHNTKLQTVELSFNTLTALDVSNNTKLTDLKCKSHFIESLDVSMCPDLVLLDINARTNARMLTSLNVEGCTKLEDLNCGCGKLTSLDLSSCTALKRLQCDYNTLTTLNVAGLTNLYFIQCSVNNLTKLDLTGCTALELLYCGNNPIAQLDLSDCTGLKRLACENNSQLTQLDVSGKQLTDLNCSNCRLLTKIDCSNNQLEANTPINVKMCKALREIHCQRNKLSGAALDSLITHLPTITTEGTIYLIDEDNGDENVCTQEQAIAIYNKGWNALRYADGEWKPFEVVVTSDGLRYKCVLINDGTRHAEVIGVENQETSIVTFAESITIPGIANAFPVTTIGRQAFKGVNNLKNIVIPDHITTIEPLAFDSCRLTKVTIAPSVTNLCDSAFVRCNVLWDLYVQWPQPLPIAEGTDPFPNSKGGCVLHVPFGVYSYQTDAYWSQFKSVETEGAQVVDEQGIMYKCYIDENGEHAFAEVYGYVKQTVTPNRIDIAESITYEVAGIKTSFPVTHIASTAFRYDDNRIPSHIVIPASVQTIGDANGNGLFLIGKGPTYLAVKATTPPVANNLGYIGSMYLIVPEGSEAAYASAKIWKTFDKHGVIDSQGYQYFVSSNNVAYFLGCEKETTVVQLPESITMSGESYPLTTLVIRCFANTLVESITLPATITDVNASYFACIPGLKTMKVAWTENIPTTTFPGDSPNYPFYQTSLDNAVLVVPAGTKSLYSGKKPWRGFPKIIELGDANADGEIGIADVLDVISYILGQPTSENFNEKTADANDDGQVTIADVVTIVNVILSQGSE